METVKCVYTQLSETSLSIKSSKRFIHISVSLEIKSGEVRDSTFLLLNTLFKGEIRALSMDEFQRFFRPVVVAERCSVQSSLGDPPANAHVHTESEEWEN